MMMVEGKPIALKRKHWEYQEFVYHQWTLDRAWISLVSDESYLLPLALEFFWETYRERILNEVVKWQDDGWEPAQELGAQGFKLSWTESSAGLDPTDVILWIVTFGLGLLLQIMSG